MIRTDPGSRSLGSGPGIHFRDPWTCLHNRSAQAIDILLPRWHQQRAPEVMLYRSAQAIDILPRWHQQRVPEVMLYRNAQAIDILPRWHQ